MAQSHLSFLSTVNVLKYWTAVLLAIQACLFSQSCNRADNDPCNDESTGVYAKGNTYTELNVMYLEYFPYNEQVKELKFLYSNDTVANDTLTYHLVQSQYVDTIVGGSGISDCDTTFKEVIKHQYKCITPKYANRTKSLELSFVVSYDDGRFLLTFSQLTNEDSWPVQIGAGQYAEQHPNFYVDSLLLQGREFKSVFIDKWSPHGVDYRYWYNAKHGFIRVEREFNANNFFILQLLPNE